MAVIRLKFWPLLILFYCSSLWAQVKNKVKFLVNHFKQKSNQGKQVFDDSGVEDARIWEPVAYIDSQITPETNVQGHFIYDTWTAASDTRLDAQTGASGVGVGSQQRYAGGLGVGHQEKSWALRGQGGISTEYDYRSLNLGLSYEKSLAEDNFVFSVAGQYFQDKTRLFDLSRQGITDWKNKNVYSLDFRGTQILTPTDVLQIGATYILQKGALEGIASSVSVNGIRMMEVLPNSKNRGAVSAHWVHGINSWSALHVQYRYYQDDWGLKAHTLRPSWAMGFFDDELFLELSYRYHRQNSVKYYQDNFRFIQASMTSDSDLSQFAANEYGLHLSYAIPLWRFKELELSGAFYHYARGGKGLNFQVVQFGLGALF